MDQEPARHQEHIGLCMVVWAPPGLINANIGFRVFLCLCPLKRGWLGS